MMILDPLGAAVKFPSRPACLARALCASTLEMPASNSTAPNLRWRGYAFSLLGGMAVYRTLTIDPVGIDGHKAYFPTTLERSSSVRKTRKG